MVCRGARGLLAAAVVAAFAWAVIMVGIVRTRGTYEAVLPLEDVHSERYAVTMRLGTLGRRVTFVLDMASNVSAVWDPAYVRNTPSTNDANEPPVTQARRASGTYDTLWFTVDWGAPVPFVLLDYAPVPVLAKYGGVLGLGAGSPLWQVLTHVELGRKHTTWSRHLIEHARCSLPAVQLECDTGSDGASCVDGHAGIEIGNDIETYVPGDAYDGAIGTRSAYTSPLSAFKPLLLGHQHQMVVTPREYTHYDRSDLLEPLRIRLLVEREPALEHVRLGSALLLNAFNVHIHADGARPHHVCIEPTYHPREHADWMLSVQLLAAVACAAYSIGSDPSYLGTEHPRWWQRGVAFAVPLVIVVVDNYTSSALLVGVFVVSALAALLFVTPVRSAHARVRQLYGIGAANDLVALTAVALVLEAYADGVQVKALSTLVGGVALWRASTAAHVFAGLGMPVAFVASAAAAIASAVVFVVHLALPALVAASPMRVMLAFPGAVLLGVGCVLLSQDFALASLLAIASRSGGRKTVK